MGVADDPPTVTLWPGCSAAGHRARSSASSPPKRPWISFKAAVSRAGS